MIDFLIPSFLIFNNSYLSLHKRCRETSETPNKCETLLVVLVFTLSTNEVECAGLYIV